jgi:hypothetical protein
MSHQEYSTFRDDSARTSSARPTLEEKVRHLRVAHGLTHFVREADSWGAGGHTARDDSG